MILNKEAKQQDVETYGTEESIDMSIDSSDQAALMMILSENLYKDPVGSLIRETASNALDAKKKANSDQPIVVKLKRDQNYNHIYSVTDFGNGISPEEVKNVLSKYAASTKRGSNDYLGYYGLGFKAPLSYTDSFTFTTRVQGIEYQYIMYKGEKGTKIDLMTQSETEKPNGTTVNISVKGNDINLFANKIREQLAYFEGVYFDTTSVPGSNIPNDFKIIKANSWKFSSLRGNVGNMHICLGDVFYEIDWNKLEITPIKVPIGLNFSLEDGILPIPSREDIKYTEDTKQLILDKIREVADYFVNKFNGSKKDSDYFGDIWRLFNRTSVTIEGIDFSLTHLRHYATNPVLGQPTLKGIKYLDLEKLISRVSNFFAEYQIRGRNVQNTFQGKGFHLWGTMPTPLEDASDKVYIITEVIPKGLQLEYLKFLYPYCVYIIKDKTRKLGNYETINWTRYNGNSPMLSYRELLNLKTIPKEHWRDAIREYQEIEKSIIAKKFLKIEDLKPTQEWLEERKKNRKRGVRELSGQEKVWIKSARKNDRAEWTNGGITFVGGMEEKDGLGVEYKSLVVYGDKAKLPELQKLGFTYYTNKKRFSLAVVNKSEQKKLKDVKTFITIDEFMKGKNKPFKVFATAFLIERLIAKNSGMFASTEFLAHLKKQFSDDLEFLEKYRDDNHPNYYNSSRDFMNAILQTATELNLFDEEAIIVYERAKATIHQFRDLDLLSYNHNSSEEDKALRLCREVLRARKVRMDWENYLDAPPTLEKEEDWTNLSLPDDEEEEEDESTAAVPLAGEADTIPDLVATDDGTWDDDNDEELEITV